MITYLTLSEVEHISALAEQAAQRTARECRRAAYAALHAALSALGHEAHMELKALVWVGRGDSFASFPEALAHARRHSDPGDVPYIAAKAPALPVYLRDGLKEIGSGRACARRRTRREDRALAL